MEQQIFVFSPGRALQDPLALASIVLVLGVGVGLAIFCCKYTTIKRFRTNRHVGSCSYSTKFVVCFYVVSQSDLSLIPKHQSAYRYVW